MINHERFNGCGFDVEDDPYCRGFWDRILWNVSFVDQEFSRRSEYLSGWKEAELVIVFGY